GLSALNLAALSLYCSVRADTARGAAAATYEYGGLGLVCLTCVPGFNPFEALYGLATGAGRLTENHPWLGPVVLQAFWHVPLAGAFTAAANQGLLPSRPPPSRAAPPPPLPPEVLRPFPW